MGQGKRKEQEEFSAKMSYYFMGGFIGLVIFLAFFTMMTK
jgi:hypothetical protein